jgi:Glu-tRNA(Gln) amidotransferase subunit E-like FAD-binding protein
MKTNKPNRLYNYLVNTYGLSKELVLQLVEDRIEDLVEKHVKIKFKQASVENMIIRAVSDYVKNGEINLYRQNNTFDRIVKEQIKEIVKDELRKAATINFSFNNTVDFLRCED